MAQFDNGMVITAAGEALYNKVQAGAPLNFTKMEVGSGQLIVGDDPTTFTALKEYAFDTAITSVTQNTQLQVAVISGILKNDNITEGKYICELGLFANDPDVGEILYGYANAGTKGDYIAPNNKGAFAWNYQVNAAIGNAVNVTATISNTYFDYAIASTSSTFTNINGTNQKEINESIDNILENKLTKYTTINDAKIINTIAQTIATYTPTITGNFEIRAYLRVLGLTNVAVTVTYTDHTGAQTKAMFYLQGGLYFPCSSGIQQYPVGSYSLTPLFINAIANIPITISVTASIANQVYASCAIVGV